MEQNTKTLADYADIVRRRKHYIVVTWLLVCLASVIIAYNLPKVYRSTATLLMEAPIPTQLVESTASQYGEEQIQSIYQRVMTTDKVLSIIESNGLYNGAVNDYTKYELAELFKKKTEVKLTTSSLTTKTDSGIAEIAFDISFSNNAATKAQAVTNELANLFIAQNDRARAQHAIKATDFLLEESDKLNRELQEIDSKIAKYKEENNFSLPDQLQANMATIDRAESELRDTDSQLRATKERLAFLGAELARATEGLPGRLDDKAPQSRGDSLRSMRAEYLRLSSIYSPLHPSVIRLKREIKALAPAFEGQPDEQDIIGQLAQAKRELALLEETYTGRHPDITKHKNQINTLEHQLKITRQRSPQDQDMTGLHTVNPAYLGVAAQYKSSQSELQSLMQKQDYLRAKLEKTQNILALSPQVEMGYTDLIRARDNIVTKYTQLKEKWLDAKLVQTLEEQQQGQTLTIIEPPAVPSHSETAIRRNVAIGGFFMGIIAGFAVAFFVEFLEPGIRGYRAISDVTGLMPLIVVPYMESPDEREERLAKQRRMKNMMAWTGISLILLVTLVVGFFSISWVPA